MKEKKNCVELLKGRECMRKKSGKEKEFDSSLFAIKETKKSIKMFSAVVNISKLV